MEEDLSEWSSKVEDLMGDGDVAAAQGLLERIVDHLEASPNASSDLRLSSALSDLAAIYHTQGLSMKAESLRNTAMLIKHRAQNSPVVLSSVDYATNNQPFHESQGSGEKCFTSDSNEEEDWEALVSDEAAIAISERVSPRISELSLDEKKDVKQRGRGAFTCGQRGLYSDGLVMPSMTQEHAEDIPPEESTSGHHCMFQAQRCLAKLQIFLTYLFGTTKLEVECGTDHVLVVDGFSPGVTMKDLEDLFKPFVSRGVNIRWINDTTALAVFTNPSVAREALRSTKKSQFKVHLFDQNSSLFGKVNEKDLEPPLRRPATSAEAARRMIVGALRQQGIVKEVISKATSGDLQREQSERKQRLKTRQKLKEEAWGSDNDS